MSDHDRNVSTQGPLAGVKVLDISTIVAAPSAAALLGDYGAEVLKVELPGQGDGARNFPPFKDDQPLWWKVINRNKQHITLDLRKEEGQEIFKSLLPHFDVLIENFRPGTIESWGLGTQILWAHQPTLIVLRATAFGQDGPYRDRPGFARVFEAMSGLAHISGEPDGQPMHSGIPIGDAVGGLFATMGVLSALFRRSTDRNFQGEEIDLSLTEASIKLLDYLPIKFDQLGVIHERSGNRVQYSAPAGVFKTSDEKWVSLSGSTNSLFAENARAIERHDLIHDPRCASNKSRCEHGAELNTLFEDWFAKHTMEEALDSFERERGTLAPIYDVSDMMNDPQVKARNFMTRVPDADIGTAVMPGVVPRFLNTPCEIRSSGKSLGADNNQVFGQRLGLSVERITQLKSRGVI